MKPKKFSLSNMVIYDHNYNFGEGREVYSDESIKEFVRREMVLILKYNTDKINYTEFLQERAELLGSKLI